MLGPLFRHVTRHENSVKELYPGCFHQLRTSSGRAEWRKRTEQTGKKRHDDLYHHRVQNQDKAAAFIDFMVSKEGNDLLRLGIEGIHYTKDGDTIIFNEEERAKDAFADDGWAHALAWGSFYWPLESGYIPVSDPKPGARAGDRRVSHGMPDAKLNQTEDSGGDRERLCGERRVYPVFLRYASGQDIH